MAALTAGDPAPWFTLPSTSNPAYHFDTVGGYRVVLFFFGSCKSELSRTTLQRFLALQSQFEALEIPFFGVSIDPDDQELGKAIASPMYCKLLWDFERQVSMRYGVYHPELEKGDRVQYSPTTFILDENLRVLQVFPLENPESHVEQVLSYVRGLPVLPPPVLATRQAPVLSIPNVFDPDFCQHLISLYEQHGGRDSGFMRQINGKTVEVFDYEFKQRRDFPVTEPELLGQVNDFVIKRVKPEIEKAFQFSITRFERHLVACYEANDQGFFNRHRDNTTKGTAHRRFAMTLNLNTGEYEGGCLRFPEYGSQLYRPGVGEAVIFSCSLLHEVTPVTAGRRFVLLSFFYNDEDAKLREQNQKYVEIKTATEASTS